LKADQARSRFKPSRVNAEDVDFSDRLNQRSYRTYAGRRRLGAFHDEFEELGDLTDEDDESVDHKLSRIRRQVEQLKVSIDEQSSKSTGEDEHENVLEGIEKISESLDTIYADRNNGRQGADVNFSRLITKYKSPEAGSELQTETKRTSHGESAQTTLDISQVLSQAADFDARLSFLESSLGLSEKNISESTSESTKPILPPLRGHLTVPPTVDDEFFPHL